MELLFRDASLPLWQRRVFVLLQTIIGLCVFAISARVLLGVGSGLPDEFFTQTLIGLCAVLGAGLVVWRVIAIPEQRHIWLPLAIGLTSYATGALLWAFWIERMDTPPFPSLSPTSSGSCFIRSALGPSFWRPAPRSAAWGSEPGSTASSPL